MGPDGRPRVLVVEDEPSVRELWCEFLRLLDCDADEASTGVEGLDRAERKSYDLLVTDLLMPGLNGWDLAWAVRRRDPSVGVILISGSSTSIDVALLNQPGIMLLAKPIGLSGFRTAVEQSLAGRRRPAAAARVPAAGPAG